jgi:hypothetical protein
LYRLTLIEIDVLRDKDDIPALSDAFTSLVLGTIQSSGKLQNKNMFSRFNRKLWLGSLTTVAAVIAVFLYLPHLPFFSNNVPLFYNSKSSIQEQSSTSPSSASIQSDSASIAGLGNPAGNSNPEGLRNATPETPQQIAQSVPKTDSLNQPLLAEGPTSSMGVKPTAAPNVSRSNNSGIIAADNIKMSLRPVNIPDRLKFVQVNSSGTQTIFNYASSDGKEFLQLTLVPFSEPTSGLKSASISVPPTPLTLSKDIQIADQKMTVIFSGNLPLEDMTNLVNTVQFQSLTSN